ncbi:hypothetical protein HMF7854_00430 [Sphingomonas ginkgonis]|uniref:DUF3344 domain-containing protein n=1 Tax=Sphingomonas ginkgonis TaxID=2315330 RepID=A0A3R9YJY5_9SPHN|nr:hypothetical protein [Sphingomonas ginkgonis]RST29463.1 hypothetical protein HMF7854_00430 [Sphingomonas ginkgonis]
MNQHLWSFASRSGLAAAMVVLLGAAPAPPPPIATYWVSASTDSGLGSGGSAGMAAMMAGRGSAVSRSLTLQLGSRQPGTTLEVGDHLPPASLGMGPSLPLLGTTKAPPGEQLGGMPRDYQRPNGRMLIYWGCGEHVGPGQPLVIDFAKLAAGQVPPGWGAVVSSALPPRPAAGRGYGEWPNERSSRAVPLSASLVGAHSVRSSISPPIGFTLGAGQDFMPALDLAERGTLPSGAARLGWRPAPTATGYALSLMGAGEGGGGTEVIVWSSSRTGSANALTMMDYLSPARVHQLITSGQVLAPTVSECLLPAEVAKAAPQGFVRIIGFGPEANFAEAPRAPKWVAKVRLKTSASLIRGMDMSGMGNTNGMPGGEPGQPGQPAKRRRPSWKDMLKGAVRPPF